jgi:hypothetical protein
MRKKRKKDLVNRKPRLMLPSPGLLTTPRTRSTLNP